MLTLFHTYWPWMGLGMAIVIGILLFCTNVLRVDLKTPRYRDPAWVAWFGVFGYMLHNFEEYGIDLYGNTYAFPALMAGNLGIEPSQAFFTAVNIGIVWFSAPIMAYLARKDHPVMAMSMLGLFATNALSHITNGGYGPGLVVAVVIFVPSALFFYYQLVVKGPYSWSALVASILSPLLVQLVLMASQMLYKFGVVGDSGVVLIQICNAAFFIFLSWLFERILKDRMYSKKSN